ncbi:MAG: 30S ribosome-binding factor RbfA [Oscillospiraceae bacterium]|nr:30S ribosome-binding factor RbfA [Oscillospiraceae bacterium]
MPNYHIDRINDDIRRVLAEKLREVKDPRIQQGAMVSITHTETTKDLRYCKVYVSVLGEFNEKEMLRGLRSVAGYLRRELGRSLDLRYTPELTFQLDDSIAHGAYINRIINDLDIQHDDDDTE